MKFSKFFLICFCSLIFADCSGQRVTRKGSGATLPKKEAVEDTIVYYEVAYEAKQKNYLAQLTGSWTIQTMKRQARMDEENLQNVYLQLHQDSTFTGRAGCNTMRGQYILKGTSIRFNNIITTKMACDVLQQETALLKLLQETVSAYTVESDQLLLRDGSSNIIFKAIKRKEKE